MVEQWEKANAVTCMQSYIEKHLYERITLLDLSKHVNYSPFYCARMFKELLGKAPFEYIRALRLTKAALRLRDTDVKVVNVAMDFVFDSHEGFTRAFSKEFGITPFKYSKNAPPIHLFMPYPAKETYLATIPNSFVKKGRDDMQNNRPNTLFVQVIDRPARKLILKRGIKATDYFEYCDEVDCRIWGLLCSIKEALYEPIGIWLPNSLRPAGTSRYAQGVEVGADYNGVVPQGFQIIDLAPCKMMVFQGQPFEDELFYEAFREVNEAVDRYNPELYGFEWADEDAPRFQLEPQGYRGYIEARPVRLISR